MVLGLNSTDFEPSNKGTWYKSEKQKRREAMLAGPAPGRGDDPLWCRYCQKRFAKKTVFDAHLPGKKHLAALRKQGFVAQAEALVIAAKNKQSMGDLKRAHDAAKRKLGVDDRTPSELELRDQKVPKTCFQPGGTIETVGGPEPKEDEKPTRPSAAAAPNGLEWWKGIPSKDEADSNDHAMTALEKLISKTSSGQPGAKAGDWKCSGNYIKSKECGEWNFRTADRCKRCGAARRLSGGCR
eukprot:SAG31_NODE_6137_length_2153_cov_2.266796_2_plen_240_part_00